MAHQPCLHSPKSSSKPQGRAAGVRRRCYGKTAFRVSAAGGWCRQDAAYSGPCAAARKTGLEKGGPQRVLEVKQNGRVKGAFVFGLVLGLGPVHPTGFQLLKKHPESS